MKARGKPVDNRGDSRHHGNSVRARDPRVHARNNRKLTVPSVLLAKRHGATCEIPAIQKIDDEC